MPNAVIVKPAEGLWGLPCGGILFPTTETDPAISNQLLIPWWASKLVSSRAAKA